MKNKRFIFIIFSFIFVNTAFAWNDDVKSTHHKITAVAIGKSNTNSKLDNYLNYNLGISGLRDIISGGEVINWLQYGSMAEDSPMCRAANHFHDPLPSKSWNMSGLTTLGWPVTWICEQGFAGGDEYPPSEIESAVFFGTGYLQPAPSDDYSLSNKNGMDWEKAREYYYMYLTGKDFFGQTRSGNRETYFAYSLQALGQVMHLLQDMSVPAHTRNDFSKQLGEGHTENHWWWHEGTFFWRGEELEIYVADSDKENTKQNQDWYNNSYVLQSSEFSITDFWDQNKYDGNNWECTWEDSIGLAEFSNANFLTEGTLRDLSDYPNPNIDNIPWNIIETVYAEDQKPDQRVYIQHGTLGHRLAAPGFFTSDYENLEGTDLTQKLETLIIDDAIKGDYANVLIPKAVNYSSALIDYFFRGTLNVFPVQKSQSGQQIYEIVALVGNTSPDAMVGGNICAVAKYRLNSTDEYTYVVSNAIPNVNLNSDAFKEFTFNFASNAIPGNYSDLVLQVVYKGTLGKENDTGIAVGMIKYTGTLEVNPPEEYVYSIIDGSAVEDYVMDPDTNTTISTQTFKHIKARIRNALESQIPEESEITAGELYAIARYKRITNYAPDLSNYPPTNETRENHYLYSLSQPIIINTNPNDQIPDQRISKTEKIEFTFDFTEDKIPANITDLYLSIVFNGTIGNDQNTAAALETKDLMEPTHYTFWNNKDQEIDENGIIYDNPECPTGNTESECAHDYIVAFMGADPNPNDSPNREAQLPYDFYSVHKPIVVVRNLPAGRHFKLILLTDQLANNYSAWHYGSNQPYTISWYQIFNVGLAQGDINQYPPSRLVPFSTGGILRGIRQHWIRSHIFCAFSVPIDVCSGFGWDDIVPMSSPNLPPISFGSNPETDNIINFPNMIYDYRPPGYPN